MAFLGERGKVVEVELNPYLPYLKVQSTTFNQKSLDLLYIYIFCVVNMLFFQYCIPFFSLNFVTYKQFYLSLKLFVNIILIAT